jgi:acetyl-CoA carboxylase biotin carboxyl carrier protein
MKKTASSKLPPRPAKSSRTKRSANSTPAFTELRSLQEIKELIEFVAEKQFDEIELERGDFRLSLRKAGARTVEAPVPVAVPSVPQAVAAPIAAPVASAAPVVAAELPAPPVEEDLHIITSPIVGTFYRSSSPTTEPFIKLGDAIEAGQTLCIVEAMKLMNEIQSDISGTVAKILVENAQPVEYGQPLFGIKM